MYFVAIATFSATDVAGYTTILKNTAITITTNFHDYYIGISNAKFNANITPIITD